MTDFPQLKELPPSIREFFRYTPEPQLLQALRMMIAQGLDPTAKDEMGNSLLMLAAATGKPMLVKFLIERFPLLINSLLNRFGENAATLAQAYCPEALTFLLQAGVELHLQNPALQWYLSQSDQVPFTTSRMQELSVMLSQDNYLNLRDETGKTLLFHAVIRGDVDVVRFLCNLSVGPAVVWRDQAGKSLFGYTTEIADVRLGSMICKELKDLRRRDRPLYKQTVDRF
jgi:ankyrin repeat protein